MIFLCDISWWEEGGSGTCFQLALRWIIIFSAVFKKYPFFFLSFHPLLILPPPPIYKSHINGPVHSPPYFLHVHLNIVIRMHTVILCFTKMRSWKASEPSCRVQICFIQWLQNSIHLYTYHDLLRHPTSKGNNSVPGSC